MSVEKVMTLEGPEITREPISGVRMPSGRIFLAFYPSGEEILEYSPSGAFVRVLARNGKGPGEVTHMQHVERIAGDTVLAFDAGRILRFDSAGRFVRSVTFPFYATDALYLGDDRVVVNANHMTREAFGEPLHIVTDYTRILRSFGAPAGLTFQPDQPYQVLRSITPDSSGGFWVAGRTAYKLERYDRDGTLTRTWVRDADWFEPYWDRPPIGPDAPPPPLLMTIKSVGRARVLVAIHRLKEDWKDHLGPARRSTKGRIYFPEMDTGGMFWTHLEVIDVEGGQVLATARVDAALAGFLDATHVMAYRQDEDGTPSIDIFRITVGGG